MSEERYVEIFQVSKSYSAQSGEASVVVEDFNLILSKGEFVSLIGHSGCGKSTVLNIVAGLNSATQGSVAVAGREIDGPGPDRAVVFQAPCLLPWMTALQNVQLGVDQAYRQATRYERREISEYYLVTVGLADSRHRYPAELSGGMQQRVGIARALALKPRVLLLDEPFGRLDSLTRMELQEVVLGYLDSERITTILVTHDVDEALFMSDRICMMTCGPRARLGQVLDLPFARPRVRVNVLEHEYYYELRATVVAFLEQQDRIAGRLNDRQYVQQIQGEIDAITASRQNSPAGESQQSVPVSSELVTA